MELVYLWVEDYKNIKNQGFNFSPRFRCEYDKDTQKLDIVDKEETGEFYPKNFFGNNINVTAIVGENGSGKSSIVEFLAEIFRIEYNKNRNLIVDNEHTFNFYLLFKIKDKTYEIKRISNRDKHSFEEDEQVENILDYHIYSNDKQNIENQIILDNSTIAKMIVYSHNENQDFKLSSFMYLPNEITIKLCNFNDKFEKLISNNELYPTSINESDTVYLQNMSNEINIQYQYFSSLKDKYHQFLIIKLLEKTQSTCECHLTKEDIIQKLDDSNIIDEKNFKLYFSSLEDHYNAKKYNLNDLVGNEKNIYLEQYRDFFEFDFIDNKKRKYSDLSNGEKILFGHLLNVYYNSKISKNENFLFLFDEPEISLHPQWQKSYIKELDSLLTKVGKNYHFVFTSHSPFVLSDLSKENIIFLKKDENGNCKNVTKETNIETFGANIHTLLSHGFFMSDGLIGEFAKGKINEAIRLLNQKTLTKEEIDYCENIISIIGEPILKRQLQKMLDSKRLSEIEHIKKQIQFLQEELAKKEDKKDD